MTTVNSEILEQARELYRVIALMRERTLTRPGMVAEADGIPRFCHELTMRQAMVLLTIRERGQVTIKELAEALQVSAPSASAMVDRLVEVGAVTREQNQTDRREVVVQLSGEGGEAVEALEHHIFQTLVDLLEKLGPEDAAEWCRIYGRIREIVEHENALRGEDRA